MDESGGHRTTIDAKTGQQERTRGRFGVPDQLYCGCAPWDISHLTAARPLPSRSAICWQEPAERSPRKPSLGGQSPRPRRSRLRRDRQMPRIAARVEGALPSRRILAVRGFGVPHSSRRRRPWLCPPSVSVEATFSPLCAFCCYLTTGTQALSPAPHVERPVRASMTPRCATAHPAPAFTRHTSKGHRPDARPATLVRRDSHSHHHSALRVSRHLRHRWRRARTMR